MELFQFQNLYTSWLLLSKVHKMSLCLQGNICFETSVLCKLNEIDIRCLSSALICAMMSSAGIMLFIEKTSTSRYP